MKLSASQKNWLLLLLVALAVAAVALSIPYLVAKHQPSLKHIWNLGIIESVAKYLLSFVGVGVTYFLVKTLIKVSHVQDDWLSELWRYLGCVGVCGFFALSSALSLGTHKEEDDETVVDYIPTDDARIREGLVLFFCFCAPALVGINEGLRELHLEREETFEETQHRRSAEALAEAKRLVSRMKTRRPGN